MKKKGSEGESLVCERLCEGGKTWFVLWRWRASRSQLMRFINSLSAFIGFSALDSLEQTARVEIV
jgi:hypothetical protein